MERAAGFEPSLYALEGRRLNHSTRPAKWPGFHRPPAWVSQRSTPPTRPCGRHWAHGLMAAGADLRHLGLMGSGHRLRNRTVKHPSSRPPHPAGSTRHIWRISLRIHHLVAARTGRGAGFEPAREARTICSPGHAATRSRPPPDGPGGLSPGKLVGAFTRCQLPTGSAPTGCIQVAPVFMGRWGLHGVFRPDFSPCTCDAFNALCRSPSSSTAGRRLHFAIAGPGFHVVLRIRCRTVAQVLPTVELDGPLARHQGANLMRSGLPPDAVPFAVTPAMPR